MTRRGRPAKPWTSVEAVGISLHPRTLAELDRHVEAMGIKRSELVRWGIDIVLGRIRQHGRREAYKQLLERRAATREQGDNGKLNNRKEVQGTNGEEETD